MSTVPHGARAVAPRPVRVPPWRPGEGLTSSWLWQFLVRELSPFPGRGSTVARMTIAATFAMLVIMTFQIPNGALGGYFALLVSREDLYSTAKSAVSTTMAFVCGAAYMLFGMWLFAGSPSGRFLWVIGTFYLIFFLIRTMRQYPMASGFSFMIATVIPAWDGPAPIENKLHATLWTLGGVALGAFSTLLVEAVYRGFHPRDLVVSGLAERLRCVAGALDCYARRGRLDDGKLRSRLLQYAMVGPASLRRAMIRAGQRDQTRASIAAMVSLTGRLLDLVASIGRALGDGDQVRGGARARLALGEEDRRRLLELAVAIRRTAEGIGRFRQMEHTVRLRQPVWNGPETRSEALPILPVLESTFSMLRGVFTPVANETQDKALLEMLDRPAEGGLFVPDAFTNRDYLVFALRGCLAATICYLFYNLVAWPGINTSVATCIITALSTIGSSRQKQMLRIGGAITGGFLIALPAQMYLLPFMDSITAFMVFFATVTALSAWCATSSPRFSYFGLQIALAFYLVNLQEFTVQISLSVARDRVVGVLVGLVAMWVAFDQVWAPKAFESMEKLLAMLLVSIGELAQAAGHVDMDVEARRGEAMLEVRALRDRINGAFSQMNEQGDALVFETGPHRRRNLKALEKMNAMQPAMRTLFLLEIALGQFRTALMGDSRKSAEVAELAGLRAVFFEFQEESAGLLRAMAKRVKTRGRSRAPELERLRGLLGELEELGKAPAGVSLCGEIVRAFEALLEGELGASEEDVHRSRAVGAAVAAG